MSASTTETHLEETDKEVNVPTDDRRHSGGGDEEKTVTKNDKNNNSHDEFLVDWEPKEPGNPHNWSTPFRCWVTFQLGMLALAASLASSIISPANATIAEYVGVSEEVTVLNVSLYVLGFAVGPLLWAPVSEIWGRRWSMLPAMFVLGLFTIGTATSTNAASVFITRFFGGVFGSAPVSNVSAALGDIWSREARGTAVSFYAIAVVGGPTLGPLIGGAILVNKHMGWRWTEYISAIYIFVTFVLAGFCMPEMYGPVLLKKKAAEMRKKTGNDKYYSPHENIKLDFMSLLEKQFFRPIRMLTTEPMVTCIAFYASFVYAILYLTLEVYPIVFEEERGWTPVEAGLPFVGLFVGVICALGINLGNQPRYRRICAENQGKPVPEARLPPMAIGGVLFVIGLFWFGWTANPPHSWVLPVIASLFIGAGFNSIFQQCINYLVDVYQLYAASATAANTFLRSIFGSGLPMAARPMFMKMGVGPAMSVLGAVAVALVPVPFLFMHYGLYLRKKSRFAPVDD